MHAEKKKILYVLINTLSLHIPLLALTDTQTIWLTEKQIHLLCMGWRNFFPVLLLVVVSVFWFWREIGFGVSYILRLQYSCGNVLVFLLLRKIVFGGTYVLRVQYSCAVVSVFWLWREIVLKMRTPFDFLWAVSTKNLIGLLYYDPLAFFGLGVTKDAAKPDCILPMGDNVSSNEGCSSIGLIVIKINEILLSTKQ